MKCVKVELNTFPLISKTTFSDAKPIIAAKFFLVKTYPKALFSSK